MIVSGFILSRCCVKRSKFSITALMKITPLILAFLSIQFSATYLIEKAYASCSDKPTQGVNWEGCRKRNLVLSGNDLRNGNFSQTNFASTDMRSTKIGGADFTKAVLIRAVIDGSSARQANFEKAVGYRASFQNSDLSDTIFRKTELIRVNFSGSNLIGANFSKSDAGRTMFDGAIMGNNNFSFANIARADFRKAIMKGAVVIEGAFTFQTRFEGVDLTNFVGLQQWQIDIACGNETTVLPEGLNKPALWSCETK
jgi:uncharacterized protein YjbI with pentapeptide repeats